MSVCAYFCKLCVYVSVFFFCAVEYWSSRVLLQVSPVSAADVNAATGEMGFAHAVVVSYRKKIVKGPVSTQVVEYTGVLK